MCSRWVDRPVSGSILSVVGRKATDSYVRLAIDAVEAHVRLGERISPPAGLPPRMGERAGVFVSLKKEGGLRGCIGTFLPTEKSIAHEVIANAIKAASADPRFPPVREEELSQLRCSVDLLSEPEECSREDLDPKRYGVIVESGWRRGLLLPDLEGVATAEEQLNIARMKAGIEPGEPVTLYRFVVERHT